VTQTERNLYEPIKQPTPMQEMYVKRLGGALNALKALDSGKYPIEDYEGLSINPRPPEKGLKWAMKQSVLGAVRVLEQEGLGDVAHGMIFIARRKK